jgi:paraquat-inducible protein A
MDLLLLEVVTNTHIEATRRLPFSDNSPSFRQLFVEAKPQTGSQGATLARGALVKAHPQAGWAIVAMLLASLGCFAAGIFLPFTAVTKLWLFHDQVSVYQGLIVLWKSGELFLFLILFMFTLCFPLVKINAMLALWLWPRLDGARGQRMYSFVSHLGKWSMLDVFIVAILVLTVKSTGIASIKVGTGFFLFFCSVMLTQFASLWTGQTVSRLAK